MSAYNTNIKEGLALLFENYWILRSEKPKEYMFLRSIEKSLRKEITERFGYRVHYTSDFIKLEKLPVVPQEWMGIAAFTHTMDYVIFCCFLSFLEERDSNSYFLLQQICEEIKDMYPSQPGLNWVNRDHRKSLIRVIQMATDNSLIESIDGDLERFSRSESAEVLYVSTSFSRYFMRPYPQDIADFHDWKQLLSADAILDSENNNVRHNVYRRLFLEPSVQASDLSQNEFYYIRNQRSSIMEFLDKNTDYHLGITHDFAYIASESPNSNLDMFPSQKTIDSILLHLATDVRNLQLANLQEPFIELTYEDFEALIKELRNQYGVGWSKSMREELSISELSNAIIHQGVLWGFIATAENYVRLLPSLGLYSGTYPIEFLEKEVN